MTDLKAVEHEKHVRGLQYVALNAGKLHVEIASRIDYGVTEAAMVKAERAMVIVEAALIEALAALGAQPL